ncbi:MAG TPA: A/G-specific adenine glycosylase [Thiobacillaceae bacterium]|nr:A/G-specific adenine glycosylase [Thiobacillaceae bacterium]
MTEPTAETDAETDAEFASRLIAWQRLHGRHGLPWQVDVNTEADPYRVWLSEIMLQQTQVETVIPYYLRFLGRFPDVAALAAAPLDEVLALWSGLGYYARARNLHAAARQVVTRHGGHFPDTFEQVLALPGVGRSTAAAIAVFTRGERRAILDGNVKRVLCRVFGVDGWPGEKMVAARLWELAEGLLPERDIGAYTQGLMDLGATLCRRGRPRCPDCPMADLCSARRQGRQAELPAARPRKPLPRRATAMLACLRAGEILLEKRPPSGIWGGLWSLPECACDDEPGAAVARWGLRAVSAIPLPGLAHSFTHFHLDIAPWRVEVGRGDAAEEPGRVWLTLEEAREAALPAPVRRIIDSLA